MCYCRKQNNYYTNCILLGGNTNYFYKKYKLFVLFKIRYIMPFLKTKLITTIAKWQKQNQSGINWFNLKEACVKIVMLVNCLQLE